MPVSADYLQYVLEQLAELGAVRAQRMFGGAGLYCDEQFFAIVTDDTLYLRTDPAGREEFTARGMPPFRPYADRPEVSLTYYQVPADVLEEARQLLAWSRRALAAARTPNRRRGSRAHRRRPPGAGGAGG